MAAKILEILGLDSLERERRGGAGRAYVRTGLGRDGPGRIADLLEGVATRADPSK
jgi:hypothetical protein